MAGGPPRHPSSPRGHAAKRRVPALPVLAGVAVAGAAAIWAMSGGGHHAPPDRQAQLLDQFRQAAAGTVASPHAYGGALTVVAANGQINVTAAGLPEAACVQAGWQLAREGTVIVNGVLPQRISAAKLAELCSLDPQGATLVWVPRK